MLLRDLPSTQYGSRSLFDSLDFPVFAPWSVLTLWSWQCFSLKCMIGVPPRRGVRGTCLDTFRQSLDHIWPYSDRIQTYPDRIRISSGRIRTYSVMFVHTRNIFGHIQTCLDIYVFRHIQTYLDLFGHI